MKKCSLCKKDKELSEYYDKRYSWCKSCTKEHRNTKGRDKQLRKRYNIDINQYNDLLASQNNACAICGTHISELSTNLAVDHCHSTLKVRGLLCYNCNSGLGRFKDNIDLLKKAIEYLMPYTD